MAIRVGIASVGLEEGGRKKLVLARHSVVHGSHCSNFPHDFRWVTRSNPLK